MVIFGASEKSVLSAYCLAELQYAVERNRPVLPFILDDETRLTLPDDLPPRGQWLVYDGNPAHMLDAINKAVDALQWHKYPDIDAPRPPEPLKGGISIPQQFQEARRLAVGRNFEGAKRLLRGIRGLDFDEWGKECNEWRISIAIKPSCRLLMIAIPIKKHVKNGNSMSSDMGKALTPMILTRNCNPYPSRAGCRGCSDPLVGCNGVGLDAVQWWWWR